MKIWLSAGTNVHGLRPWNYCGIIFPNDRRIRKSKTIRVLVFFPASIRGKIRTDAMVEISDEVLPRLRAAGEEAAQSDGIAKVYVKEGEYIIPVSEKWGEWKLEFPQWKREHQELVLSESVGGIWSADRREAVFRNSQDPCCSVRFSDDAEARDNGCPEEVFVRLQEERRKFEEQCEADRRKAAEYAAERAQKEAEALPKRLAQWEKEVSPCLQAWMALKDEDTLFSIAKSYGRGGESLNISFDDGKFSVSVERCDWCGSDSDRWETFDLEEVRKFFLSGDCEIEIG